MSMIEYLKNFFSKKVKPSPSEASTPEKKVEKDDTRIIEEDWKFCAIIKLHVKEEEYEDSFQFEDTFIRIFRPSDDGFPSGLVAEVYAKKDNYTDITDAYFSLEEVLERFLHRLALVTFRKCRILKIMGISRFKVGVNEEFDILMPDVLEVINEEYDGVKLSEQPNISRYYPEVEIMDALREVKLSLETNLVLKKYHHYYNAIERLATLETTEFVSRKCSHCGKEEKIEIKATANKMLELFLNEGFTKKDFKKCRSLRGKIAHGSGNQGQKTIEQIRTHLGKVEKVAANTLSRISGINILDGKIPRLHTQFAHATGVKLAEKNKKSNAQYHIVKWTFSSSFSFNKVEDTLLDNGEFKPLMTPIPVDLSPENFKVFPYLWPY